MRKKFPIIAAATFGAIVLVYGVRATLKREVWSGTGPQAAPALDKRATAADRQINAALGIIERAPNLPVGYNLLATAYLQKARETGDLGHNTKVEAALKRSFEVAPDNHDATRIQAYLLLSYHRFNEALDVARRATAQEPRDYESYGALVDALVELGYYEEARKTVQTMLDIRPYTASYARASYLRSLYGNSEGAIEAMRMAAQSASPADPESLAWCYVHLGDELMNAGKPREAEHEYDRALFSFPDYHLALAAKARTRVAAGDNEGAIELYQRAEERVPLPDTAIALGDLYTKLGRAEDAKRQYELVEFIERKSAASGTYSRQLALFWADHDVKLDEALAIVQRERSMRRDIFTCDALAWVLFKHNRLDEAKKSIEEALRLGTRDARLFYHAGMIYHGLGDKRNATKYLNLVFKLNPTFDLIQADVAKRTLEAINGGNFNRPVRSV